MGSTYLEGTAMTHSPTRRATTLTPVHVSPDTLDLAHADGPDDAPATPPTTLDELFTLADATGVPASQILRGMGL